MRRFSGINRDKVPRETSNQFSRYTHSVVFGERNAHVRGTGGRRGTTRCLVNGQNRSLATNVYRLVSSSSPKAIVLRVTSLHASVPIAALPASQKPWLDVLAVFQPTTSKGTITCLSGKSSREYKMTPTFFPSQ